MSNVYGYVGTCFGEGNNLAFYNNSCAVRATTVVKCPSNPTMYVAGNTLYTPSGLGSFCNSSVAKTPNDTTLIEMGQQALAPFPQPAL